MTQSADRHRYAILAVRTARWGSPTLALLEPVPIKTRGSTVVIPFSEDPRLIQNGLERRLMAARETDPTKRRDEALRRDLVRIRKGIDRLLTAYQEGLLPIEELRERMPELRRLDVSERQRIMRLLVKEVLVGDDKIIIRHCIPLPNRSGDRPPDGA